MAQTMTPSDGRMTDRQIEKAVRQYREMLWKHCDEIGSSDAVQQMLERDDYLNEQVGVLRRHVGLITGTIIHFVTVNRRISHEEHLAKTGRKLYVNDNVVATMPRRRRKKTKLVYFEPGPECYQNGWMSCATLAEEYAKRGLVPDPDAQSDDNAEKPEFADEHPNACQWVDEHGNFCCAAFNRVGGGRRVRVNRSDGDWLDGRSFAGVPK